MIVYLSYANDGNKNVNKIHYPCKLNNSSSLKFVSKSLCDWWCYK